MGTLRQFVAALCTLAALASSFAGANAEELTARQRICLTAPPGSESFLSSFVAVAPLGSLRFFAPIVTPTPSRIVAFNADLSVTLWNVETGERMAELAGRNSNPILWDLSADGSRAVIAGYDAPAVLWNLVSGRRLADLPFARSSSYLTSGSVQFSPDGERLVAADGAGRSSLWDGRTGELIAQLHPTSGRASFEFVGGRILRRGDAFELWDRDGRLITALTGDGIRFDGISRVVINDRDGWALVDLTNGHVVQRRSGEWPRAIPPASHAPRGASSRFFVARNGSLDDGAYGQESDITEYTLWDVRTARATLRFRAAERHISMFPNSHTLMTRDGDGEAFLWEARTGHRLARLGRFVRPQDTEEVFSSEEDAEPYSYWRLRTGESLPFELSVSPDGTLLVTRDVSGEGVIWDTRHGRPVLRLGPLPRDTAFVFSPTSRWVIVAATDGSTSLWSIPDGLVGSLGQLGRSAPPPIFSPDEEMAVVIGADWRARLWRIRNATLITELGGGREFEFSPDSERLIVDGDLWHVRRGIRLGGLGRGVTAFATLEGRGVITKTEPFAYVLETRDPSTGEVRRQSVEPSLRIYDMDGSPLGACAGDVQWFVLATSTGRRVVTVNAAGVSTLWRPVS